MTKYLLLCFLLASTGASVRNPAREPPEIAAPVVRAGLVDDTPGPAPNEAAPAGQKPCDHVSFSRGIKYGESDLNVLDVATGDPPATSPRPVLLFVAGESFGDDGNAPDAMAGPLQDAAMCFAARSGMVGVKMSFRRAPASAWPSGAKDVAAAVSWIHQNIDLFGGSPDEVVTIGYSAGAFHVASFLAHPEFQEQDSGVAGAVLVSGIYAPSVDGSAAEKAYFGADPSKYGERSAFPGILNLDTSILLAWSADDPPRLVTQGEKLRELLCHSPTQCPRTAVLKNRDSLASVFTPDAPGESLAEPVRELIREIEARGLP